MLRRFCGALLGGGSPDLSSMASVMEPRCLLLAETPTLYPQSANSQTQPSIRPNAADRGELRIKFERPARFVLMDLIRPSNAGVKSWDGVIGYWVE